MDCRDKWPKLADAVYLMQMDNGYCDEGGIQQALQRAEAEDASEEPEVTLAQLQAAEAWCAVQSPEDLDLVCSGCMEGDVPGGCNYSDGARPPGKVVFVPEQVARVLDYLFDNM